MYGRGSAVFLDEQVYMSLPVHMERLMGLLVTPAFCMCAIFAHMCALSACLCILVSVNVSIRLNGKQVVHWCLSIDTSTKNKKTSFCLLTEKKKF